MQEQNINKSNGVVSVDATLSNEYALKGIVNKMQILVEVKTGALPEEQEQANKRMPLNLAIVLDRSGSMAGDKLKYAKEAIIKVIENLTSADILHLVVYGTNINTIFENATIVNREELVKQVNDIVTEGCTNLWGGVTQGATLLTKYTTSSFSSRLFLFSDGLVNEGLQNKEEIQHKVREDLHDHDGINVSAFGLGKDFDEELMEGIAENGQGAYFFIEGSESIPQFVDFALNYELASVAKDAVLKIKGKNSGIISKVFGYKKDVLVEGIRLGDLRALNVRTVVCQIELKIFNNDNEDKEEEIAEYCLEFKKNKEMAEKLMIKGAVKIIVTADEQKLKKGLSKKVNVKVIVKKAGEMDKKLIELMNQRKTDEAIKLQEKQVKMLEEVLEADQTEMNGENKVEGLLKQARTGLERLRQQGVTTEAKKEAHHREYTIRRGCGGYSDMYY